MPAASSKRSTPARKKTKLDHVEAPIAEGSTSSKTQTTASTFGADLAKSLSNDGVGTAAAETAVSTPTPSRTRDRRAAQQALPNLLVHADSLASTAVENAISGARLPLRGAEPTDTQSPGDAVAIADTGGSTQTPARNKTGHRAPPSASNPTAGAAVASTSAAVLSTPEPSRPLATPQKETPRPPLSAKGKGKAKAKLEDAKDQDDDEEETRYGKLPDLEIFTQEGPLSSLHRLQLKTNKPRSMRPLWVQGIYQPSFFGIPSADTQLSVHDSEADRRPNDKSQGQSFKAALPWPSDGYAKAWLDPKAYALIKTSLVKFWSGQVGWVPNEGIYDMGWYPGKAIGYKENSEMSAWVYRARLQVSQSAVDANEVVARGQRAGWPFIQPWLDAGRQNCKLLSKEEARALLQDDSTPQRGDLRHPTTVMRLTVPELTMRTRLKRSIIHDTPMTTRRTPGRKGGDADADGAGADDGQEEDEEEAGDDDEAAIAAVDANQEPINPDDPKFANIPNLGFEEKGPIHGDVLHISVGPPDREVPVQIAKGTSKRLDSLGVIPDEGHLLNVGGHVYDLDWAPIPVHLNQGKEYFAVSAATTKAPLTIIGQRQSPPAPASIQIWSVSPDSPASVAASSSSAGMQSSGNQISHKGEARLEMVIYHDAGAAFKLAWCPIGHDYIDATDVKKSGKPRRLGILAGCFADGSISVFSVPHPETMQKSKRTEEASHLQLKPILKFEHPTQTATSLAWAGGEMLAFGGSQGWIGVWNIGRILREPRASSPPPDYVVRAHRSAITGMTFILLPPIDSNGRFMHSTLPMTLFTVALDGLSAYVNLTRSSSTSIERSRTVHYACDFSPFSGGSLFHEHADGTVAHYSMRSEEFFRSRTISHAPSRNLSISCSPFHPIVAIGTAHGEVKVANTMRTLRRSQRNHLPVYQTVLNRTTGEMVKRHHLEPEIANNAEPKSWHIATWHPCLAVTAVKWNPNLGRCRLLLSGTAAGVVKVDFMKPPYENN